MKEKENARTNFNTKIEMKTKSNKHTETNSIKSSRGITLVALVVTIVVLIILATVSINAVLGENGLIKKAQQAQELHEQGTQQEQNELDAYVGYLDKELNNGNYQDKYLDSTLPVSPRLAEGMTKVKYNSTSGKWEKVTDDSTAWYNYANKEWANVVLGDATFNSDGTLDETRPYTQLVWIPRFAYQITSYYHTAGDETTAGNINVVFIDENNQDKEKTTTYSTTYPSATAGATTGMSGYVVHPAFDYDGKHLTGFWMGKFESSHTGCTTDVATGQADFTGNEIMTVKANVTSWRNITIGDAFTTCLNMNRSGNPYGLRSSDAVVDPHMVKNTEWGAVAYLSKSIYGKNTEEVYINNSYDYITGNAGNTPDAAYAAGITNAYNTTGGVKASTTGNVYGVYDMSGADWEIVTAYVNNGHGNLATNGSSLINAASKYKNVYTATDTGGNDSQSGNYDLSIPTNGHYGDALYETSGSYTSQNAWYKDYSNFPYTYDLFFARGGGAGGKSLAGVFSFNNTDGDVHTSISFRMVVPVI